MQFLILDLNVLQMLAKTSEAEVYNMGLLYS